MMNENKSQDNRTDAEKWQDQQEKDAFLKGGSTAAEIVKQGQPQQPKKDDKK